MVRFALIGSLFVRCAIGLASPTLVNTAPGLRNYVQSLDIPLDYSPTENFSSVELSVLQDLYNGNDGVNWRWKSDQFGIPWNFSVNANPCIDDWQGIDCTLPPPFDTYHVANLTLPNYGLNGSIPASLGQLYYLEALDLLNNQLSGTVPYTSLNSTSMSVLSLAHNYISGTIPESLGDILPRLAVLELSKNQIYGTFPAELNLTQLEVLDLRDNRITGTIPESLRRRRLRPWLQPAVCPVRD